VIDWFGQLAKGFVPGGQTVHLKVALWTGTSLGHPDEGSYLTRMAAASRANRRPDKYRDNQSAHLETGQSRKKKPSPE
jgi:hypothetical protein